VILDTNGLSAVAEGEPGLEPILRKAAQVAIPVIVLGEYRYGISQSLNRKHYERWLAEYLPTFRILDVDERTTSPTVPSAPS
jgi:tRNA(fMet)-specific endonuclease VapC